MFSHFLCRVFFGYFVFLPHTLGWLETLNCPYVLVSCVCAIRYSCLIPVFLSLTQWLWDRTEWLAEDEWVNGSRWFAVTLNKPQRVLIVQFIILIFILLFTPVNISWLLANSPLVSYGQNSKWMSHLTSFSSSSFLLQEDQTRFRGFYDHRLSLRITTRRSRPHLNRAALIYLTASHVWCLFGCFLKVSVFSLRSPKNPQQKIIKRVIGLEGDFIR